MPKRDSTTQHYRKLALIVALTVVYVGMILLLRPYVGNGGAPFAVATAILGGWFFGVRGGLIVSVLLGIENVLFYRYVLDAPANSILHHGNVSGLVALVIIGGAVGHMGTLSRKVKAYTELLQHEAFHDPLTGLPNRALFYDRLEHAMARASRGTNSVALLFLDLDGFKQVKDRYGHLTGDRLLAAFAERIQMRLRLGDTFARLAGDEFVIVLEDLTDLNAVERAAERITEQLRAPFMIGATEILITASIGIAFRSPGSHQAGDLLHEADRAMYQAKSSGKARHQFFQPEQPFAQPTTKVLSAIGD
jgi:diguanylate cyclase (GGDEF)-like protein